MYQQWEENQNYRCPDSIRTNIESWTPILYQNKKIQYFFEITIPAALKRNEPVGHTLLICHDVILEQIFIELFHAKTIERSWGFITHDTNSKKIEEATILTGFTSVDPNGIVCQSSSLALNNREWLHFSDSIRQAMTEFKLSLEIGGNPIKLDLPCFTYLLCISDKEELPCELLNCFENVLKFDKTEQITKSICKMIIKIKAKEISLGMTDGAVSILQDAINNDYRLVLHSLKRVEDYILVNKLQSMIDEQLMKKIVFSGILQR